MGRVEQFTNPVQPSSAARTRGWSVCLAVVLLLLFWYLPVPSATLRKTPAGSTYRGRVKNDFDWNQLEASPKFNWVPCYAAFQCAKFEVPLDYTEPDGPKASIAVLKRPSKFPPDDSRHRGAIFYNPGGPGASGVNFLSRVAALFVEIIGDDFDHVSFDPRGVGRSTPAPIVFKSEAELRAWEAKDFNSLNYTADGVGRTLALAEVQGRLALQRASRSAAHLGTADVARDIVAMNAALGRDKIQYWGGSYGTILGVTLAAMYPNKIERMVIDSVMEASTYYRTTWDRNLLHTDDALDWFFTSCSASPACPLHESSPGAVRARYDRIVDGLKQRPIAAVQGDVYGVVDWPLLRNMIFPWLYKPYATFPQLAQTLADLEKGDGTLAYTLSGRDDSTWTCSGNDQPVGGSLSYSVVNSAILCGDGDPVDASLEELQTWHRVQASLSIFADLHPVRIWCAGWKIRAKNPFTGSLSANTSHPIFLMGTTADPVAPLESAHETAKRFPGSVVLGVEAPGHGAILVPSVCMAKHLRAYMREGTLPPAGTLCKADRTIFPTDQDLSSLSAADRRLLAASEQLAATIQFPRLI